MWKYFAEKGTRNADAEASLSWDLVLPLQRLALRRIKFRCQFYGRVASSMQGGRKEEFVA